MINVSFVSIAAEKFNQLSQLVKEAYIKKLPNGQYRVYSQKGKNLGTYDSEKEAEKRLRMVEFFKHLKNNKKIKKKANKELDLQKIEAFSLSSIMRKINKQLGKEACYQFLALYKKNFDKRILNKEKNIEENALKFALQQFNKKHIPIKINIKLQDSHD